MDSRSRNSKFDLGGLNNRSSSRVDPIGDPTEESIFSDLTSHSNYYVSFKNFVNTFKHSIKGLPIFNRGKIKGTTLSSLRFLKRNITKNRNTINFWFWRNPFKIYPIYRLSSHSILIEKVPFTTALEIALRYFRVRKKKNLIWKKIYYQKSKKVREKADAYKFFYHTQDSKFIEYILEQTQGNNHLNYDIKRNREGVYIKLVYELYTVPITYALIKRKLDSLNIPSSDSLIRKILEEKEWVKVQEAAPPSDNDGKVTITVSQDALKVFATKTPPNAYGREVDEQDILEALQKQKIVFGIIDDLLRNFLKEPVFNKKVLIGNAEVINDNYHNIYEEFYLSAQKAVDSLYQKDNLFFIIGKDDIILKRKIPKNQELKQHDVFGRIHAPDGEDKTLVVKGENTYFDEDGNLRSSIEGTLIRKESAFVVHEVLTFDRINIKTGNITHKGSLMVEKDIEDGIKVSVTGNIFVKGNVAAAEVEAGGNIVVHKGINGAYKALIKSTGGSISANYIRNSSIYCKKDLIVKTFLNDCKAWVGEKILVDKVRGTVLGGEYYAFKELVSYHIGSVSGWKTYIQLGIPIEVVYQINQTKKQIQKIEKKLFEKKREQGNSQKFQSQEQGAIEYEILKYKKQVDELNVKLKELESEKLNAYADAQLLAWGNIHPGVILNLGNLVWENKYTRNGISLSAKGDPHKQILMKKIK